VIRYAYPDVAGGKVDIRVSVLDNGFRLEFTDYGKGVPPEVYPQLFQPFVTSGRDRGGTGLGLAISHNIVTNILHGKIRCESAPGQGSTFVVDLPRVVPDQSR
jgi:signal transduction histidine kinase